VLHFTQTESTFSYFEASRAYLQQYGKPVAFYSDRASVFRPTHTQTGDRGVTHFGRAMYELNIDTWCANSSSAKGRVERAHLTLQDRLVKDLLDDTPANRRLIHRYIEVWEYPDGRIEVRADGAALPCTPYDRLARIDQGAVIGHKRLGHVLQVAQALQAQRDDRRASGSPSRTNRGLAVERDQRKPGTKKQRVHPGRPQ
jgi:hypothetical protein